MNDKLTIIGESGTAETLETVTAESVASDVGAATSDPAGAVIADPESAPPTDPNADFVAEFRAFVRNTEARLAQAEELAERLAMEMAESLARIGDPNGEFAKHLSTAPPANLPADFDPAWVMHVMRSFYHDHKPAR